MKLGTETASLVNHIHSRAVIGQPEPMDGMAATILGWTDRYAATIVHWDATKQIAYVREDKATPIGRVAFTESQQYEYEPNSSGALYLFRRQTDGRWQEVVINPLTGRLNKVNGGHGLRIGQRNSYRDPSF